MKNNAYDLLTIGDTSIDLFMRVEDATVHCDVNEEHCKIEFGYADKIPVQEFHTSVAGNSINVAVGAQSLGLKTAVYTETGDDDNADLVITKLNELGVETKFIRKNEGTTSNIHPIIVYKGERTIFSYHQAQKYHVNTWGTPKIIYYTSLAEGFEEFQKALLEYLEKNSDIIFAMNPGTAMLKTNIPAIRNTFERLDILFVNKDEAEKILETETDVLRLHKRFSEAGVKMSVITDSLNGVSVYDGKNQNKLGIVDFGTKVDATGAGDSFAAGFISAIHYGKSAKEAIKWGTINAASVITKVGAIEGLRTKNEMTEIISHVEFTEPKIK